MINADLSQQKAALIIDQLLQQAIEFHQAGQLQNAERLYRAVLQMQPSHSDAKHNLSLIAEQIKQVVADLPKYKAALEADPAQGQHWQTYAEALLIVGQAMEALLVIKTARECGLENSQIQVLQQRAADALQDTQTATTPEIPLLLDPNIQKQSPTHFDDAELVKQPKTPAKKKKAARKPKSISRFNSKCIPLPPNAIEPLITLFNAGHYPELEKQAQSLLNQYPDGGFIWKVLGAAQQMQGKDALQALQKATELMPDDSETHNNLGAYLVKAEQFQAAEACCRRALQINKKSATAHYNLGNALLRNNLLDRASLKLNQYNEAISCYRQSLTINPDNAEVHFNLGNALTDIGQYDQAVASFQQAVKLRPDYADAYNSMGHSLLRNGKLNDAETSFRHALKINPNDTKVNSNLLFVLNYHPDLSAQAIYKAYQEYDAINILPLRSTWQTHQNDRKPNRRLRIGYVSPDFYHHSCSLFVEPLLTNHDKTKVEIFAYAELHKEDEASVRYKNHSDHWIPTKGMSDEALATRIRQDGIDILVDLAGHTIGNRLLTFARKPAPVSLSWLGYGYTTGVSAIDYYLTDEISAPANSEELFTEQPLRIATPAFSYRPNPSMGKVSKLPALKRGYITFGTLTRSARVNHHTIRVWSMLLKAVPTAHLMINSIDFIDPSMQQHVIEKFVQHGIASERLEIGYQTPPWDLLRNIDIGLDCFPHNSGTTLFETLYMGIPYITLAGRPSVGRLGSSILQGLGHPEWIAENEEEYIAKGVALANDLNHLSEIRATLRDQMENSPLRDEKGFALKVEKAYRKIWKTWCKKGEQP